MKIKLIEKINQDIPSVPFAVYPYDESFKGQPNYIDIREIVHQRYLAWLDEAQSSHDAQVAKKFLRHTRWWWATPMSRLDVRPWGQEYIFKPLFFARAIIQWIETHPEVKEIVLLGCEYRVARYLKEFDEQIIVEGIKKIPSTLYTICTALKNSLFAFLKLITQFLVLCKDHLFQKAESYSSHALVLYDLNPGDSLTSGHKFFYGDIFDTLPKKGLVSYACTSGAKIGNRKKKENAESQTKAFYLLDHIGLFDAVSCVFVNTTLIFLTWIFMFDRQPCTLEGRSSKVFWIDYLFNELNRMPCLKQIGVYRALKKVLNKRDYQVIVYPYEEKGSERSVLFACGEKNVETIGYTPHPQHRLALALRDADPPLSPKPTRYAVCGDAYVDYFQSWGRKTECSISVWGSGKSFHRSIAPKQFSSGQVNVLLLISHPNELRVFASWMKSQKAMSQGIVYFVRLYKALACKELDLQLKFIASQFPCVRESQNSLEEDLSECHLAAFCGTSAGIVAVKQGCLAVHLALDDFFPINPCFDQLEDMLSCQSAEQFVELIKRLRPFDEEAIQQLYERQKSFADKIFSSMRQENIQKDIMEKG